MVTRPRQPVISLPPPSRPEDVAPWAHRQFVEMSRLVNELLDRVEKLEGGGTP
jgi:hypothetical protein